MRLLPWLLIVTVLLHVAVDLVSARVDQDAPHASASQITAPPDGVSERAVRPKIVVPGREPAAGSFPSRISGGYEASAFAQPWIASVQKVECSEIDGIKFESGTHLCGGTLIASNMVLTSAHCVVSNNLRPP